MLRLWMCRCRWHAGADEATLLPLPPPPAACAPHHTHTTRRQVWRKVIPLGLIFFVASFNLTILQVRCGGSGRPVQCVCVCAGHVPAPSSHPSNRPCPACGFPPAPHTPPAPAPPLLLQNLKDAIMVTTAGAETLPFLASCVVLPASLAFFMLYGKMVEALPHRTVFYAAMAPLLAFYVAFTAVLYPAHGSLHLTGFTAATAAAVPAGLLGLLKGERGGRRVWGVWGLSTGAGVRGGHEPSPVAAGA